MKLDQIKQLIDMLSETDIVEFELETEEFKVAIRQGAQLQAPVVPVAPAMPAAAATLPATAPAPSRDGCPGSGRARGGQHHASDRAHGRDVLPGARHRMRSRTSKSVTSLRSASLFASSKR